MNDRAQRCLGWISLRKRRVATIVRRIRRTCIFIVAWVLASVAPHVVSLHGEGVEYPVKLAFLYNFTKFIEWPPDSYRDAGAPLAICIVGSDPFSPDTESDLRTLSVCHMVFVPATEKDQVMKIVRDLKGSSTLTVGESEGFAGLGGIINLTVEGNRVGFEVNQLAAERAGLKISSKLLSLAKLVKDSH
jgi:hypothetical protein